MSILSQVAMNQIRIALALFSPKRATLKRSALSSRVCRLTYRYRCRHQKILTLHQFKFSKSHLKMWKTSASIFSPILQPRDRSKYWNAATQTAFPKKIQSVAFSRNSITFSTIWEFILLPSNSNAKYAKRNLLSEPIWWNTSTFTEELRNLSATCVIVNSLPTSTSMYASL